MLPSNILPSFSDWPTLLNADVDNWQIDRCYLTCIAHIFTYSDRWETTCYIRTQSNVCSQAAKQVNHWNSISNRPLLRKGKTLNDLKIQWTFQNYFFCLNTPKPWTPRKEEKMFLWRSWSSLEIESPNKERSVDFLQPLNILISAHLFNCWPRRQMLILSLIHHSLVLSAV